MPLVIGYSWERTAIKPPGLVCAPLKSVGAGLRSGGEAPLPFVVVFALQTLLSKVFVLLGCPMPGPLVGDSRLFLGLLFVLVGVSGRCLFQHPVRGK